MAGKNYLELCNDILEELYFEPVDSFSELEEISEGRRVKRLVNQANNYICNNENTAWTFREKRTQIVLVPNMIAYDRPNGFIQYMKYNDRDIVLSYYKDYKYLPNYSAGLPVGYYISNNKINMFPTPREEVAGEIINVEYYTDDFAEDCCGLGKPEMTLATDESIIPAKHRDVIIFKVCADWRANDRDGYYEHYESKFKRAYRALRKDCQMTDDLPAGFHIESTAPNIVQSLYNGWYISHITSRGSN